MDDFWGIWDNDYDYEAQAADFERRTGLSGISRTYVMPPDHDMKSLEHEIKRRVKWAKDITLNERMNRARAYAETLTALNPELEKIRYDRDDLIQTWHVLLGATTGFNPDDIDYFINAPDGELRERPYSKAAARKLSSVFNTHVEPKWNISQPTLVKIVRGLNEKYSGLKPQ